MKILTSDLIVDGSNEHTLSRAASISSCDEKI